MESLIEIGIFLLKVAAVALACILVLGFAISAQAKLAKGPKLKIKNWKQDLGEFKEKLSQESFSKKALKALKKKEKKKKKPDKVLFVLKFFGDIRASAQEQLRQEINAVLSVARAGKDEVVIFLESRGGTVNDYGLAASQLNRIREHNLYLTICVDRVAGSGGYMMACAANKLIAAPFSFVGSIGVITAIPNLHKVLKKRDVDYVQITSGKFKRTVTMFGEVTQEGREKMTAQIEDIHHAFKNWVLKFRPHLDMEKVGTGEVWLGEEAHKLGLVDELMTSEEFLFTKKEEMEIFSVEVARRKKLMEKVFGETKAFVKNHLGAIGSLKPWLRS